MFKYVKLYTIRVANGELLNNPAPLPETNRDLVFFVTDPYLATVGQDVLAYPVYGKVVLMSESEFKIQIADSNRHLPIEAIKSYVYLDDIKSTE